MLLLRQIGFLVAKDLRIEGRTRATLGLVVVLGILIVTVLGLGLSAQGKAPPRPPATQMAVTGTAPAVPSPSLAAALGAPAILWVAYLFSGVLCFEKTMAVERQEGALAGLLLAPIDRGVIFLAKLISNLALMLAVAAAITPVGVLFFGFDLSPAPGGFALVIVLSMLGFAAVGTLFAALVSSSRLQGGLLAMAVFPIVLPLVIASTNLLTDMFREGQTVPRGGDGGGMLILLAFDAIFLVTSWLIFEIVLEP